MEHDVWEEIQKQRRDAIDDPPKSFDGFKSGIVDTGYFSEFFEDSGAHDPKVPLSYYTKACGWASDYPFLHRRVMVYLNPGGANSHLSRYDLPEYVRREFGCTLETFEQLLVDKWFLVLLSLPEQYDDDTRDAIQEMFERVLDREEDVRPRYLNLVDDALGAAVADRSEDTFASYARGGAGDGLQNDLVDIDRSKELLKEREPWQELSTDPFTYAHVEQDSVRDYVSERVLKLQLAADALPEADEIGAVADSIRNTVENDDTAEREDLIRRVYINWNQLGTPMYYCDFSGNTDIGPVPAREYADQMTDRWSVQGTKHTLKKGVERLKAVAYEEVPNDEVWFKQSPDVDLQTVFGFGPGDEGDGLAERVDAHGTYYQNVRADLLNMRNTYDTRSDILGNYNQSAEAVYRTTERRSHAGSVVKMADGLANALSFVDPTAITSGVSLLNLTIKWFNKRRGIEFMMPRPKEVDHSNIGRLSNWSIDYGDGESNESVEPGQYMSEAEIVR